MKKQPLGEPMLWLVFGIPALTLLAGSYTLYLAAKADAVDVRAAPVTRVAQVQTSELAPDRRALALQLVGTLQVHVNAIEVTLTSDTVNPPNLDLQLEHPIHQSQDQTLHLHAISPQHWRADFRDPATHDWQLTLTDEHKTWRLVGRWRKGNSSAPLRAALRTE